MGACCTKLEVFPNDIQKGEAPIKAGSKVPLYPLDVKPGPVKPSEKIEESVAFMDEFIGEPHSPTALNAKFQCHVLDEYGFLCPASGLDFHMKKATKRSEIDNENREKWEKLLSSPEMDIAEPASPPSPDPRFTLLTERSEGAVIPPPRHPTFCAQSHMVRQPFLGRGVSSLELKQMVLEGVPIELRGRVWAEALGAIELKDSNPGRYSVLCLQSTSSDGQIEKDVSRVFASHPLFRSEEGRDSLRRVLRALAAALPHIGYVQGMSFLAATFLLHADEEMSFWMLVGYMKRLGMEQYYYEGLFRLTESTTLLGSLITVTLPALCKHFGHENVLPFCYATPWFLTAFTYNMPLRLSCRLLDIFFVLQDFALFREPERGLSDDSQLVSSIPSSPSPSVPPSPPLDMIGAPMPTLLGGGGVGATNSSPTTVRVAWGHPLSTSVSVEPTITVSTTTLPPLAPSGAAHRTSPDQLPGAVGMDDADTEMDGAMAVATAAAASKNRPTYSEQKRTFKSSQVYTFPSLKSGLYSNHNDERTEDAFPKLQTDKSVDSTRNSPLSNYVTTDIPLDRRSVHLFSPPTSLPPKQHDKAMTLALMQPALIEMPTVASPIAAAPSSSLRHRFSVLRSSVKQAGRQSVLVNQPLYHPFPNCPSSLPFKPTVGPSPPPLELTATIATTEETLVVTQPPAMDPPSLPFETTKTPTQLRGQSYPFRITSSGSLKELPIHPLSKMGYGIQHSVTVDALERLAVDTTAPDRQPVPPITPQYSELRRSMTFADASLYLPPSESQERLISHAYSLKIDYSCLGPLPNFPCSEFIFRFGMAFLEHARPALLLADFQHAASMLTHMTPVLERESCMKQITARALEWDWPQLLRMAERAEPFDHDERTPLS